MRKQKPKSKSGRKGRKKAPQLVIDTSHVKVKEKIQQYEAMVEEVVGTVVPDSNSPNSMVISDAEDPLQPSTSNRLSIVSNSSVDSTQSEDKNIQLGTSKFYVVWD